MSPSKSMTNRVREGIVMRSFTRSLLLLIAIVPSLSAQICAEKSLEDCVGALYETIASSQTHKQDGWRAQYVTLSAFCGRGDAALSTDKDKAVCAEFGKLEASVAAFNHATGKWRVAGPIAARRTEFDINGIPTIAVRRSDSLVASVENTNPLLYIVTADDVVGADIDQIAQLKELAKLIGGNLQTLVRDLGQNKAQASNAFTDSVKPILDLQAAAADIDCLLSQAQQQSTRIASFANAVESNATTTYMFPKKLCSEELTQAGASAALDRLAAALREAQKITLCSAVTDASDAVAADDPATFIKEMADLNLNIQHPGCTWFFQHAQAIGTALQPVTLKATNAVAQKKVVDDARKAVADAKGKAAKEAKTAVLKAEQKKLDQLVDAYKREALALRASAKVMDDLVKGNAATVTAAKAVLTEAAGLPKLISQLTAFDQRIRRNSFRVDGVNCPAGEICTSSDAVVHALVIPGVPEKVRWDTIETHGFHVKTSSAFASAVDPLRAADTPSKFKLRSASSLNWDIGVSLTGTRIADPTFTAVDTNLTNADGTTKTVRIITKTDERTRAGELALLANFGVIGWLAPEASPLVRRIGIEVGSTVDVNKPAFFLGISVPLTRFVRIGGGFTSQRVTQLHDSNKLGSEVANTEAIKKRQGFENGRYLSLSVSLGSIGLFNKP